MKRKVFISADPYGSNNTKREKYSIEAGKLSKTFKRGLRKNNFHQFVFEVVVDFDPNKYPLKKEHYTLVSYNADRLNMMRGQEVVPDQNDFGWIRAVFIPPSLQRS